MNSEARKGSRTKRLDNYVFSFQIVSLEKDIQDQADITFLDFSSFMCIVIEVWTSHSASWDEEIVSIVAKEDVSLVEKGAEQNRLR